MNAQCTATQKIQAAGFRIWEGKHDYKAKVWCNGYYEDAIGHNSTVRVYSDSGYAIVTKEGYLRKETMSAEDFALLLEKSCVAKEVKVRVNKALIEKKRQQMRDNHPAMQELRELASRLLTQEQVAQVRWYNSFDIIYRDIHKALGHGFTSSECWRFIEFDRELHKQMTEAGL